MKQKQYLSSSAIYPVRKVMNIMNKFGMVPFQLEDDHGFRMNSNGWAKFKFWVLAKVPFLLFVISK